MEKLCFGEDHASISADDIPVSAAMVEAGLAVLEETDAWPLSRLTVERAFQAMFHCALRGSVAESSHQQ